MVSHQVDDLPPEYDILTVGVALYDPKKGKIVDTNNKLELIMGYPTNQLREIPIERYTANTYSFSEEEFISRLRKSASGHLQQFNWRIKRGDGQLIWARIRLSEFPDGSRERVFAEIHEITDYYNTSHRAELFWRLLRHNLRNEATVIHGNAALIGGKTENNCVSTAAEVIRSRATKLGSIADSVKEIEQAVNSADEQGVCLDAAVAIREIADAVETDYTSANINVNAKKEMWIQTNEAFEAALVHALENAIVHNERTEQFVEVTVGLSPNTGRVDIQIMDRNLPIPDTEINPLYNYKEATSTSHGSGVGLFVMKWCIEALGGEIEFERQTPEGNTVHFYLPPKKPKRN